MRALLITAGKRICHFMARPWVEGALWFEAAEERDRIRQYNRQDKE